MGIYGLATFVGLVIFMAVIPMLDSCPCEPLG